MKLKPAVSISIIPTMDERLSRPIDLAAAVNLLFCDIGKRTCAGVKYAEKGANPLPSDEYLAPI